MTIRTSYYCNILFRAYMNLLEPTPEFLSLLQNTLNSFFFPSGITAIKIRSILHRCVIVFFSSSVGQCS